MKRLRRRLLALALWLSPTVALAAPQPEAGWGLPRDVSADGWRIDWLLKSTGWLTAILFVIMVAIIVRSMTAYRAGKYKAHYDHGVGSKSVKMAVTISALIFFIVDGNLFVNAMVDLNKAFWTYPTGPDVLRLEVNAQQWAWNFRYAGPDGKFNTPDDILTLNDLRVPTDKPVLMQLAAKDVIHSLYLPNLRVKIDAMPGMINQLTFQAKQTGEFDIACAQHCGTHHYKMGGTLTVLAPEQYARWAKVASEQSARAYDPDDKEAHWGWEWKEER